MKTNGSDEYSINKQNEFVQETTALIENLKGKVSGAIQDLSNLIDEIQSDEVKSLQEYTLAVNQLTDSKKDLDGLL